MNGKTFGKQARDSREIGTCIYEATNVKWLDSAVCDEWRRKTPLRRVNGLAVKVKTIRTGMRRQSHPVLTNTMIGASHG